ncbi:hypothetical protein OBBRIDRAFT_886727 [Obba rivulosa]|uniref:MYND-type domain-containing protein n=1 Tax=Obba rivulosa TaxID=1052685 RepID=A0A8E2AZ74_9APHY|nr:hypothetical protein OBBRIDRAFT_886727 [Obba rivulosa]
MTAGDAKANGENGASKLLICAACQLAFYCNRECQRGAWPIHKFLCTTMSASNANLREFDAKSIAEAPRHIRRALARGRNVVKHPLAEEVSREFGLFGNKFSLIFEEAYCRAMESLDSKGKSYFALGIDAERIPDPPDSSRPWARFRIKSARLYTFKEIFSFFGPDFRLEDVLATMSPTLKLAQQRTRPDEGRIVGINLLRRVFRTLNVIVPLMECIQFALCAVPVVDVREGRVPATTAPDPSSESMRTSIRTKRWEHDLIAKVEHLCGRAYVEEAD